MSLIADALKRVQSAGLAKRYGRSEPSGVLPVAAEGTRGGGLPWLGSIFSGSNLSPNLWVGLGSGIILFVVLFVYFFYGPGQKVKSRSVPSSLARGKGPVELIVTPPPEVPAIKDPPVEEKVALAKQSPSLTGGKESSAQPGLQTRKMARSADNTKEESKIRPSAVKETQSRSESLKVSVTPDLSEEVRSRFNLALSHQEGKDFRQASREYERVIQMWPLYVEAHNNLGVVYKELRMYDKGIAHLKKALVLNPGYIRAYHNLGVIYQLKGDLKQAKKNYERVLSLDRSHLSTYNNLGLVYRTENRLHEAREVLEKALVIKPTSAETHYNLALVLEGLGELKQARFHYQKFLGLAGEKNRRLVKRVKDHLGGVSPTMK